MILLKTYRWYTSVIYDLYIHVVVQDECYSSKCKGEAICSLCVFLEV